MRLLLVLAAGWCRGQSSSPEELVGQWRAQLSPIPALIDPYNYLSFSAKSAMISKMSSYFSGFNAAFFVFHGVDARYKSASGKVDIVRFGDDLLDAMFANSPARDNALVIVYAIDDRVFTIRTGSRARQVITDDVAAGATQAVVPYMQRQDYNNGFPFLLDQLYQRSRPSGGGFSWWWILLLVLAGPLVCCCWLMGACRGGSGGDYYGAPAATPFSDQQRYGPGYQPTPFSGGNLQPTPFSGGNAQPTPFSDNQPSNYGGTAGGWGNDTQPGNNYGGTAGGWGGNERAGQGSTGGAAGGW